MVFLFINILEIKSKMKFKYLKLISTFSFLKVTFLSLNLKLEVEGQMSYNFCLIFQDVCARYTLEPGGPAGSLQPLPASPQN